MTPTNEALAAELFRLTGQPVGPLAEEIRKLQAAQPAINLQQLQQDLGTQQAPVTAPVQDPLTKLAYDLFRTTGVMVPLNDASMSPLMQIAKGIDGTGQAVPQVAPQALQQAPMQEAKPLFTAQDFMPVGDGVFKRTQKGKPTEYTNVLDSEGKPSMTSTTPPDKGTSLLSANVRARLDALQKEENISAKQQMLAEFQTERAAESAQIEATLRADIENKYNIPAMRQLAAVGSSDAGRAAKYRQDLAQAQSFAEQEFQRAKAGNIRLQSLTMYGNMAENVVANATKIDQYSQQRDIYSETSGKQTPEQKKQALLESTRPEVIRRMRILDPSLADKEDADIAVMVAGNTKGGKVSISPEELATLQASPQQLIGMAAKGSQAALKMFVEEEKALTGEDTSRDIQNVQAALRSPDSVKKLAAKFFGSVDSEGYKAFNLAQSKAATSKEAKAEFDSAATNMAVSVMAASRAEKAAADISNWAVADEALKQVIGNIKSSGRPADILTVAREYGKTLPREQRAQAIETMKNMVNANMAKYDKSLLGPVDKDRIIRSMEDEIAKSRMGELLDNISSDASAYAEKSGLASIGRGIDASWKYLFDPAAK